MVLAVTVLLVAVAACVLWLRAPPDPVYKGRRLSSYLYDLRQALPPSVTAHETSAIVEERVKRQGAAVDAVMALGPKAVPLIADWMKPESTFRRRIRNASFTGGSRSADLLARFQWVRTSRMNVAYDAAELIPKHCSALIPTLRATIIEHGIGWFGPPRLLSEIVNCLPAEERRRFIKENAALVRQFALRVQISRLSPETACILALMFAADPPTDTYALLRRFRQSKASSLPNDSPEIQGLDPDGSLRKLLDLEFENSVERITSAADLLAKSRALPEKAIPMLTAHLHSSDADVLVACAESLGSYSTNATVALPALTNLLADTNRAVVTAASNAIARIEMVQSTRANSP